MTNLMEFIKRFSSLLYEDNLIQLRLWVDFDLKIAKALFLQNIHRRESEIPISILKCKQ